MTSNADTTDVIGDGSRKNSGKYYCFLNFHTLLNISKTLFTLLEELLVFCVKGRGMQFAYVMFVVVHVHF